MSKVISFDVDGVLANFTRGFTRVARRLHGTPVGTEGSQYAWMFEDVQELCLDTLKCDAAWEVIWSDPTFWEDLDPLNPSVMHLIDELKTTVFITNRKGPAVDFQTRRFLSKWGVHYPNVIVAEKKGPVAKELGIVAHIDDYFKNCLDIKEAVPDCYTAMLATPYNTMHRDTVRAKGINIVMSVDHFIHNCEEMGLAEWIR